MMITTVAIIRVAVISLVVMVGHSWLPGAAAQQTSNVTPYIIMVAGNNILRINLNDWNETSGEPITLISDPQSIVGIDYHYRLGYVFWTSESFFGGSVKKASLEDGSNITTLVQGLSRPGDLAVDWINDKLYWTDRGTGIIGEYDLIEGIRKEIINTRVQPGGSSAANGLAIYPYPNNGWLYWTDSVTKTIETVAITGDSREVIRQEPSDSCVYPLLLEYITHTIYWIDTCAFFLKSVRMDGSRSLNEVVIERNMQRSTGMTLFRNSLYWTESFDVYTTNITTGRPVHHLFRGDEFQSLGGIEVVHPDKQPNAEEFIEKIFSGVTPEELNDTCPTCIYGQCIPPGLCACDTGFRQSDCSEDINECETVDSRCDHHCNNTLGSFICWCNEGYILHSNGRSCIEIITPTLQLPEISSTLTPLPLQPSTVITSSPVVPTSAHVTSSYISSSLQPTSTFIQLSSINSSATSSVLSESSNSTVLLLTPSNLVSNKTTVVNIASSSAGLRTPISVSNTTVDIFSTMGGINRTPSSAKGGIIQTPSSAKGGIKQTLSSAITVSSNTLVAGPPSLSTSSTIIQSSRTFSLAKSNSVTEMVTEPSRTLTDSIIIEGARSAISRETPIPTLASSSSSRYTTTATQTHSTSTMSDILSSSVSSATTTTHPVSIMIIPQPETTTTTMTEETTAKPPKPDASGLPPIAYIVGGVAALVIIILLVVNIVVIAVCFWKRHKMGSYKVDHEKRPPMITVVYHRPNSSSSAESKSTTSTANSLSFSSSY